MFVEYGKSKILLESKLAGHLNENQAYNVHQDYMSWDHAGSLTADEAYLPNRDDMVATALHLERTEPLASGTINKLEDGVVNTGLRPEPHIDRKFLKLSDKQVEEFRNDVERVWGVFSRSKDVDYSRRHSFWRLERLQYRSRQQFGDVFGIRRYRKKHKILGTCIQLIEGQQVDTPYEYASDPNHENIKHGIEFDKETGEPKAIFVKKKSNSGLTEGFEKILFRDKSDELQVIHLSRDTRLNQSRGLPRLSNVSPLFKLLGRITEGEASAFALMSFLAFKHKVGSPATGNIPNFGVVEGEKNLIPPPQFIKNLSNIPVDDPDDLQAIEVNRPNPRFEDFTNAIIKMLGCESGLPYEVLLSVFQSSYSASQASTMIAERKFRIERKENSEEFNQVFYEWSMKEAIAKGYIRAPGFWKSHFHQSAYLGADWIGDGPMQIDLLKTAKGWRELHELGVISLSQIAKMYGLSFDRVVDLIRQETKMLQEARPFQSEKPKEKQMEEAMQAITERLQKLTHRLEDGA